MTHRFPIKEIARQAGLGPASVDRVLNNRAHVSTQTRARVIAAIEELERQEQQLSARGRRVFVDVVAEAPKRFSSQIQNACEAVLPDIGPVVFRPRFTLQEIMDIASTKAVLDRIRKRGSQGVLLKTRDVPELRYAIDALAQANIPVITLVTDVASENRFAYVGVDNSKAGQTAAYLLAKILPDEASTVLTSRSQDAFQGEAERYSAFCNAFIALRPSVKLVEFNGAGGLDGKTRRKLHSSIAACHSIDAVYSMGGGNRAILDVLKAELKSPTHFIAHDLDRENIDLLQQGKISFVLHHDLLQDMRHAFRAVASYHGLMPPLTNLDHTSFKSDVQIVTPFNIPRLDSR